MARGLEDRRGLIFAGLVVVVALVGIYVTLGGPDDEAEGGRPDRTEMSQEAPVSAPPPPTPVATASDAPFDIYSFLPMSKQELAAAADVAQRFVAAYGTYRFDEDPLRYAQRLKVFTTAELGAELARSVSAPAVVEQNRAEELVSTGSARLKEIRQIERSSVIFVVAGLQDVATKAGPRQIAAEYAVTLTQVGSDWRVHDIQPAGEGQEGDPEPVPQEAE